MRKSDGRVSSLDALINTGAATQGQERKTPDKRFKKSRKKYLFFIALILFCSLICYITSRIIRTSGNADSLPKQSLNYKSREGSNENRSNTPKLQTMETVRVVKKRTPVVVIEHKGAEHSGDRKGPVNFGTSLEIVAPK